MGKKMKTDSWKTLEDAAEELACRSDRHDLARCRELLLTDVLNDRLKVSIRFPVVIKVRKGSFRLLEEIDGLKEISICRRAYSQQSPGGSFLNSIGINNLDGLITDVDNTVFEYDGGIIPIGGVWDMAMIGNERIFIDNLRLENSLSTVEEEITDGFYICDTGTGEFYEVQWEVFFRDEKGEDQHRIVPEASFPQNAELVFRTSYLEEYFSNLPSIEKESKEEDNAIPCTDQQACQKAHDMAPVQSQNYFVFAKDFWKVKFDGGDEANIKANAPMKTLIAYLDQPRKKLDPGQVYEELHIRAINPGQAPDKEGTAIVFSSQLQTDHTKAMTSGDAEKLQRMLVEKRRESERLNRCGKVDEAQVLENELEATFKLLSKQGIKVNEETGELLGWNKVARGRNQARENGKRHLDRAVDALRRVDGLAEHIEKYFIKGKNYAEYLPPEDFQGWIITY